MRLILLDSDLKPKYAIDSTMADGIWRPDRDIQARDRLVQLVIAEGYILRPSLEVNIEDILCQRDIVITDNPEVHIGACDI